MESWKKVLNELNLTTDKPVSEGTIMWLANIDLYKITENNELRETMEQYFKACFEVIIEDLNKNRK